MGTSPKLGAYNYRYGAMAGGIGIAFSLMLFLMGMTYDQSSIIQTINVLIPASMAVIAITTFKKDNAGLLSLKQAIKAGVGVFLVAGIIGLAYFTVFINFVETDFTSTVSDTHLASPRDVEESRMPSSA